MHVALLQLDDGLVVLDRDGHAGHVLSVLHSLGGCAEPQFGQGHPVVAAVEPLVLEKRLLPQRRGDLVGHRMGDAERLRRLAHRRRSFRHDAPAEQVFGHPG